MLEPIRPRAALPTRPAVLLLLALAILWSLIVGSGLGRQSPDTWTRFMAIGDTLARVGGTMDAGPPGPRGLTARTAYLLAFHEAQDAMDGLRMRVAANSLANLGEARLASHLWDVIRAAELEQGGTR